MNGKFDKMNETINSLTQFKGRQADLPFLKDQSKRAESKTVMSMPFFIVQSQIIDLKIVDLQLMRIRML